MSTDYPVVVYGASGYTGKLVCNSLAQRRIPFVAAGRNKRRLEEAVEQTPGADARVREVPHTLEALRDLARGAAVVINVVGPFGQLGRTVVEAALAEGCHYLDTTGEQDYVLATRRDFHEAFERAERVLYPACAYMWTTGLLAAEACLEMEGIDSLDIVYAGRGGRPTLASNKSFMRMNCREHFYLANKELVAWPPATKLQVLDPGTHEISYAVAWGGGCEPVWLHGDERVRNCRVMVSLGSGPFAEMLVNFMKEFQEKSKTLSNEELENMTNDWGQQIADPPDHEDLDVNRFTISCIARGRARSTHCVLTGVSPYTQTGVLCAEGARRILDGKVRQFGFVSGAQAFGARELMDTLAEEGLQSEVPSAEPVFVH